MKNFIIFLLLCAAIANAQSPYELSETDYKLGAAAIALNVVAMTAKSHVQPLTHEQVENMQPKMNRFDRVATLNYSDKAAHLSDALGMACMLAPYTMLSQSSVREDFAESAVIYAETMLINAGAVYIAKSLSKRPRPFVFNPNTPMQKKLAPDARMAFYSGHTSMSFASAVLFAKTFNDYFPDSNWSNVVWAGSLITAGTVGCLRVAAGRHYPTDVLVGALVGGAIGYFIPKLHKVENKEIREIPPMPLVSMTIIF